MTSLNTTLTPAGKGLSLVKAVLIGAFIGLAIISVFVFGADKPDPAWGQYWQIKPLLLTPLVAAAGGAFFYLVGNLKVQGYLKALTIILSVLGFIAMLWIGVVLGLNGTMWD